MIKKIQDLDLKGKLILLRLDLNLPIVDNKITDNTRLIRSVATINYLRSKQAKIIIISHLGRPSGYQPELSLKILIPELNKILATNILFCADPLSEDAVKQAKSLKANQILLLENIRFYPQEEKNELEFAKKLAKLGEIYINDSFSCSHRAHASITILAKLMPAAAGLLLQEELNALEQIINQDKLIGAIVGGSKISSKLALLNNLISRVELLVIGGAMANTLLKAQGYSIGNSYYEEDLLVEATNIISKAKQNNCQLILPIDLVVTSQISNKAIGKIVSIDKVNEGLIVDLGPLTVELIKKSLSKLEIIVWNGPVGAFEYSNFDWATKQLALEITRLTKEKRIISIAGGGDTIAALNQAKLNNEFSYLSTAGGAFLEWLEGKTLPGIESLQASE